MAKDFYYGIPTYRRTHEQLTLQFLKSIGVERERIVMATQEREEFEECRKLYSDDCIVIFREAHNASGNRNTIIEYFPKDTNVLILDDDIISFEINRDGLKTLTGKEFEEIAGRMFKLARRYGSKLWSVYPVRNAYFMETKPIVKANKSSISVHGVITSGLRFDESQTVKEDFLFVCDNFARGYPTLRLDNVVANAKHLTNAGGCKDHWGTNGECLARLLKKYPQYIRLNSKREGEVLLKNINIGNCPNKMYLW